MAFVPWHDHKPLILTALEVWQEEKSSANLLALTNRVEDAIKTQHVKQKGDLLIEMNEDGIAYSAMDQADMGIALIESGLATGNKNWISLGKKSLNVLLTDVKRGGLRKDSGGTSWFHGQTSRDSKSPGGTLNKHMAATRDLIEASQLLGSSGKDYYNAGIEGAKQLASDRFPNLKDYFVIQKGKIVRESWLYYSINTTNRRQYFLKNNEKNPVYHVYELGLLKKIHTLLGSDFPLSNFNNQRMDGTSLVRHAFLTYKTKLQQGLNEDKKVSVGNFAGLPTWRKPLDAEALAYFESTYVQL